MRNEECDRLVQACSELPLHQALVRPAQQYASEKAGLTRRRTNKNLWLEMDHPLAKDLQSRLSDLIPHFCSGPYSLESPAFVRYEAGELFETHHDALEPFIGWGAPFQNRIATAFLYLNDVEEGGETTFPRLKATIHPTKGSLALWFNFNSDGTPDMDMIHSGNPVKRGVKLGITQFIWGNVFSDNHPLDPNLNAYCFECGAYMNLNQSYRCDSKSHEECDAFSICAACAEKGPLYCILCQGPANFRSALKKDGG